jgi:hypothetical protein
VHAILVAGRAQQLQIDRIVHAHAAGALHERLDDDGRYVGMMFRERRLHLREHATCMIGFAHARLARIGVGRGRRDDVHQQRLVDGFVQIDVAHRERAERLAVVAVRECDETGLARVAGVPPEMEAHLDRDLDRGGAVVREEAAIEARGREARELLGERHGGLVREAREDRVFEPA